MSATVWMWLVTTPEGEDRIVPILGGNPALSWDEEGVEGWVRLIAEAFAEKHGLPLRLAKMVEVE